MLEDFSDAIICLGRTFKVFGSSNLPSDFLALFGKISVLVVSYLAKDSPWISIVKGNARVTQSNGRGSCEMGGANAKGLTCSGVTGFCEVLCNSSMVFWS